MPERASDFHAWAAEAIELSQAEAASLSDRVRALGETVRERCRAAERETASGPLASNLMQLQADVSGSLSVLDEHIERRTARLDRINVVVFGRTGAGKSTLIEALTRGDGAAISQEGRMDNTLEVTSVEWSGLRLVDTPGIQGWGGREDRDILEQRAHDAVAWADVVVLAFDDLNAKVAEFDQIAAWVIALGKPAVAVVNVKGCDLWRLAAAVPDLEDRVQFQSAVSEYCPHVASELAAKGLLGAPVVAVSSQRAFAARGTRPLRHPFMKQLDEELERFGEAELERCSNLLALTQLIERTVRSDPKLLRLGTLHGELKRKLEAFAAWLDAQAQQLDVLADAERRMLTSDFDLIGRPGAAGASIVARVQRASTAEVRRMARQMGVRYPARRSVVKLRHEVLLEESIRESTPRAGA